ncbi:MAG: LacI family transcriptional regulator [Bifidobacteriaceae bacterium]|nr:LacI family transcriptional regulator [Bifidobacteriaceae bacterium]
MKRPPSMLDVARAAGVSHTTVARVVNGAGTVTARTEAKVLAAIGQLHYRRNAAARALVTRQTQTIGVILANSLLSGPSSMFVEIERKARDLGYWVSVASLAVASSEEIDAAINHFRDQGVDAMVVMAPTKESLKATLAGIDETPCVVVTSGRVDQPGAVALNFDQEAGAKMAMAHLLDHGHRSIAHLAGPLDEFDAQIRMAVWRKSLAKAGLPEGPLGVGNWLADLGYSEARRILEAPDRPTAIFGGSDQMALGALRAAFDLGIKVPQDLSVIGFDDMPGSGQLIPPLTTVRQDLTLMGETTLGALTGLIEGEAVTVAQVKPSLVVRASVAPARRP